MRGPDRSGPAGPGEHSSRVRERRLCLLPYFQEASAKFSWVSGLTFGGLTSPENAMEGGELEMGSPGRMSITISLSSW